MKFCFVDEAGCLGTLPSATSNIQPVLVVVGLIIDQSAIESLTRDFNNLKRQFFPYRLQTGSRFLDWMCVEIKGSDLRASVCLSNSRKKRHALTFMDRSLRLLEKYCVLMVGRVWIKQIGSHFSGKSVYASSIQTICNYFQNFLHQSLDTGLVIADSRTASLNTNVSHSIFTKKYSNAGDPYNRILETPTFGHSDNHVGLQMADLLSSALLFPLAVHAYCTGYIRNLHVRPGYSSILSFFGQRVKYLQHRYQELNGRWTGGIVVSDGLAQRNGKLLFGDGNIIPQTSVVSQPPCSPPVLPSPSNP